MSGTDFYGEVVNASPKSTSRFLSMLVLNAGYLADAEWHVIVLRLEKNNITVTVDQVLTYIEEPGLTTEFGYDNVKLFIGGITEKENDLAKKIFPNNFKGCIDQIATEEQSFITNYTGVYSENIKSCQLFP
ncbi:uncharacterized protein LOC113233566 [Hyposmocoma kahamanoa]|uniref:uncharacterized protein LOC113233566 n=1 Tax=Hyposmocoma kahamanoa TaxID=1477025 RepID=UPI000E6D9DD5|nr:uncharacterized protein LOC113233566 [Hyposmocoma kahamanoa]